MVPAVTKRLKVAKNSMTTFDPGAVSFSGCMKEGESSPEPDGCEKTCYDDSEGGGKGK